MKVKVTVTSAPLNQVEYFLNQALAETQADLAAALVEQERMFQEKRDAERKAECAERDFANIKRKFADVCAERDNLQAAYNQLQTSLIESQKQAAKTLHEHEEKACDTYTNLLTQSLRQKEEYENEISCLRDELLDRNTRVAELEQRITYLQDQAAVHKEEKEAFEDALRGFDEMRQEYQKELAQAHSDKRDWMQSAEQWRIKYETEHKAYEEDKEKADNICKSCDEIYERVVDERNHLRSEVERLTTERDAATTENTELIFENSELKDAMKVAEETIEKQRKMLETASETITNLRRPATPSIWDIMRMGLEEIEKYEAKH